MTNHYRLNLLVAAIGMSTASVATAADTKTLHAQNLGAVPASSLAAHLNLGQNMSLTARSSVAVAGGNKVVRQQQMFRGVPVYGRSIAVVQDAHGTAPPASGALLQGTRALLPQVAPQLSGARAPHDFRGLSQPATVWGTAAR